MRRDWLALLIVPALMAASLQVAFASGGDSSPTVPFVQTQSLIESLTLTESQSQVPARDLAGLHWRLIGPFRSGRALAVAGVPQFPNRFYFGGVDGGVWETNNAGRTWTPIFDSVNVGSIGDIAVSASDPNVIYVGTGEADMRSDIGLGHGVFKSTDAGKTWTSCGLEDSQAIGKVLIDPSDPSHVFVAALGHPYGPNKTRGVYETTDGGKSWNHVLNLGPNIGAVDVEMSPGDPSQMFASAWQTRRPPWNVYPPSNGPGSGLYESTDGGKTWSKSAATGLPKQPGRIGIAFAPSEPSIVYALVDAADGGLFRSDDGGHTWKRVSSDTRIWTRGWYFMGVTVNPSDPNDVFVCNTALYESKDGGKTFIPVKGSPGGDDYHTLWIDPQRPSDRILGVDQGVVVSVDGGKTWSSWYNEPIAQIYHIAADNRFPYWVYGAQQDSGAMGLPSRTFSRDGLSMMDFREIAVGGESGMLAPDPLRPNIVYGGGVGKEDVTTGTVQSVSPTLRYPGVYRSTWTLPLVFSPADPRALYYGNQYVFRTRDGGAHWDRISPDLSRPDPGVPPNLDDSTAANVSVKGPRRGVVYAIAPSAADSHTVWAGTDDGLVWRTSNDGKSWKNVTPTGLTAWSKIGNIDAPKSSVDTAYISVDRHRLDDDRPYIYRTDDGGKGWKLITNGIPAGDFINVVRSDPANPSVLYAGSEKGVWFSLDRGSHWQSLKLDLPTTSVRDLIVKNGDLVIATHGRGVYILDDANPVRWMKAAMKRGGPVLFPIPLATIVKMPGFTGTPLPKTEPRGENPADGAVIDWLLPRDARQVTITIEKGGHVLTLARSGGRPWSPPLAFLDISADWLGRPEVVGAEAGLHRWHWNLRDDHGQLVPPGTYTAKLTVDGKSVERTFSVRSDPRLGDSTGDAASAYLTVNQLRELSQTVGELSRSVTALHRDIQERLRQGSSAHRELEALDAKVVRFGDVPPPPDPRNSVGTPLTSADGLRALSGQIGQLQGMVSGPLTPDESAAFSRLRLAVSAAQQRWSKLSGPELKSVNEALAKVGEKSLKVRLPAPLNPPQR